MFEEFGPPRPRLRGKVPTGIKTIDLALDGGFPVGSIVLLYGKPGIGKTDLWNSIAYRIAAMKEGAIPEPERTDVCLPENLCFVSMRNSGDDVLADVRARFSENFFDMYSKHVKFADFIPEYFSIKRTSFDAERAVSDRTELEFAPPTVFARVMERASLDGEKPWHIFRVVKKISDFLGSARNSVVMLESLNELIRVAGDERSLISSLFYLRKENSSRWGSVIYTYMSEGIFAKQLEEAVVGTVDNVMMLEGTSVTGGGHVMRVRKFRGHPSGTIADTRFELFPSLNGVECMRIGLLDV